MGFWSWFRRRAPVPKPPPRPRPDDWTKTIDDLMAEKRRLSTEELDWARSYERDRLRAWARFPLDREEFEAIADVEVDYLLHWQAPFTGSGKGMLPRGTRIRVSVSERDPERRRLRPARRCRTHRGAVGAERRPDLVQVRGYSLFISIEQLNKAFLLCPPQGDRG